MNLATATPSTSPARWTRFASPARFDGLAAQVARWCWVLAIATGLAGMYVGFFVAPTDATQGEAYRILFIHVPAAWLSMVCYLAVALWAVVGWVFKVRMASRLARALAPSGALYTAMALWTGALWGQPTWGTWWVWDARLTSELILLLLYLGYIALVESIDDDRRAAQAGALIALVGALNVPVIYFSVKWWNTLHQGASISMTAAPTMARQMLLALALCTVAFWAHAIAASLTRARALSLEQEPGAAWAATPY
ncbi:heme ABC transporter permease CcmC [Ideonella sp. YS5]|uniref:heme ABC transporter permease CcmC n=1 Tax=Ideonella sp. YS5 TaxID=3453714 RepID=UPI003EEB595E